jgi:uncharacterized membrane protein
LLLALVNFIDEHLATNNPLPKTSSIHTKVGSVLLISTLFSFLGAFVIFLIAGSISITQYGFWLSVFSAIPQVIMYGSYFYLLQKYSVHLVAPIFQISSIWLVIFELLYGVHIPVYGLIGIVVLLYGALILDTGSFRPKIPSSLLILSLPGTLFWAIALTMVKFATVTDSAIAITFWQLVGIGVIGIILLGVRSYRRAFLFRIGHQKTTFLSLSAANETFAQLGYLFANLAIASAPVVAYVSAITGVQGLFLLLLFVLFPQGSRTKVSMAQWIAVVLICIGIILIEGR